MRWKIMAALAAATLAAPAPAEWHKASSRHFTVYSEGAPAAVTELATRLETLDGAMRMLTGIPDTPESAANPVTVYVVENLSAMRRLARDPNAAGFYIPRAAGAVAFTPRRGDGAGRGAMTPQIVLFHEYAHHFILSNMAAAYPAWLSEGLAEFYSTTTIDERTVMVGHAANHRAYSIGAAMQAPMVVLFDPRRRQGMDLMNQVYGRGWALTHYLLTSTERRRALEKYLLALNAGVPSVKAAQDSFGDLSALDRALEKYVRGDLSGFRIDRSRLAPVKVELRPLTPGEAALIESRMISDRGVSDKEAAALYARAAKAAGPHGNDPVAQGWLAEMAHDAGHDDVADAAADRALAADPRSVQALLYKGRVQLKRAVAAKTTDPAVWTAARRWIIRANRVDPNAAAPLELFHDSFRLEGTTPSASAVAGLHRALELAPQDRDLRFKSVAQHLTDGEVAEAKRALRPLAFDPHAGPDNPAVRLMALLDAGQTGPAALAAMTKPAAGKGVAAD